MTRYVLPLLIALSLTALSCTNPSAGAAPTVDEAQQTYGVVAAPPLPLARPVNPFDPSQQLATRDGAVIVDAGGGAVTVTTGRGERRIEVGVGTGAELRALSGDGLRAALFEPVGDLSRITVVDLASGGEPVVAVHELPGLVEPEAFSTDGSLLFVIDHQAAEVPGAYRVRPLDLGTGVLEDILGPDKIPFNDDMNGVGRRQVWSPDGTRIYTLYIRQTHHHHHQHDHQDGADGSGDAHTHGEPGTDGFVHVLDLAEEWAFCPDLPPEFGGGELATTALAVSPDGSELAVADLAAGRLAVASTADLVVTATSDLPAIEPTGALYLGLTGTAVAFGWGDEVRWFGRADTEPLGPPVVLDDDLFGLSGSLNGGTSIWAWTNDMSNGPIPLWPPGT